MRRHPVIHHKRWDALDFVPDSTKSERLLDAESRPHVPRKVTLLTMQNRQSHADTRQDL